MGEKEHKLTDDERAALLKEELKLLRVAEVARDMMVTLVTLGYQKMGLTKETLELRNLDDARLAIELLRAMIDVMAHEPAAGIDDFRSTLASMQLQYARTVGLDSGGADGPEPARS